MATAYPADDPKHEREVTLKVPQPEWARVAGAERFFSRSLDCGTYSGLLWEARLNIPVRTIIRGNRAHEQPRS